MSDGDGFESERTWLRRAAVLVRREPDLRWKVGAFLLGGAVLGPAVNVFEYGFALGAALEGLGWGLFAGLALAFVTLDNRMESVFPEHGDDEDGSTEADDSLRSKYVRGEIDHETFRRRLDEKLREPAEPVEAESATDREAPPAADERPAGDDASTGGDPVAVLQARFARGEIDEAEYRERLRVLRETSDDGDAGADTGADAEGDVGVDVVDTPAERSAAERE